MTIPTLMNDLSQKMDNASNFIAGMFIFMFIVIAIGCAYVYWTRKSYR